MKKGRETIPTLSYQSGQEAAQIDAQTMSGEYAD
jgi:hypothetical protein